mmetsp:Transcript_2525/g.5438  ORF Transcript_2525/g.5438 Transcript_2525/m.5438 type:complete len:425 (+) Transcript_2525:95-1369(+)
MSCYNNNFNYFYYSHSRKSRISLEIIHQSLLQHRLQSTHLQLSFFQFFPQFHHRHVPDAFPNRFQYPIACRHSYVCGDSHTRTILRWQILLHRMVFFPFSQSKTILLLLLRRFILSRVQFLRIIPTADILIVELVVVVPIPHRHVKYRQQQGDIVSIPRNAIGTCFKGHFHASFAFVGLSHGIVVQTQIEVGVEFVLFWIGEVGDERRRRGFDIFVVGGGGVGNGLEFGTGQCHFGGVLADGRREEFAGESDDFSPFFGNRFSLHFIFLLQTHDTLTLTLTLHLFFLFAFPFLLLLFLFLPLLSQHIPHPQRHRHATPALDPPPPIPTMHDLQFRRIPPNPLLARRFLPPESLLVPHGIPRQTLRGAVIIPQIILDQSVVPEVGVGSQGVHGREGARRAGQIEHAEASKSLFGLDGDVFFDLGP